MTRVVGLYDIAVVEPYAGANSIIASGSCDLGKVTCDTGNSTGSSVRINCFDNSGSPALFDPTIVRIDINGTLT